MQEPVAQVTARSIKMVMVLDPAATVAALRPFQAINTERALMEITVEGRRLRAMQAPFAARIDQPIAHQRLQDVLPIGALARVRQQRRKEPIQFQLLVEMTGEPARAPLARAIQLHRIEPHLHAQSLGMIRHCLLGGKQRKLPMSPARFVKRFDLATPRFALAIIDLAQIKNRALHHTTTGTASAFDNAPVAVLLAVLPSPCESQVHGPRF